MRFFVFSKKQMVWSGVLVICLGAFQVVEAEFIFGDPVQVLNVNEALTFDGGSQISRDGLELYFVTNRPLGSNTCFTDIWMAKRSSLQESWSNPIKVDFPGNTSGPEASPCISADGLELFFSDGYPPTYREGDCVPHPSGLGRGDLWVSTRVSKNDPWGEVENLGVLVNSAHIEDQPSLSADGLSLYFISDRPGGHGWSDLYVTTRLSKDDPWGAAVNLGATVNGNGWETTPFISPNGLSLYFSLSEAFAKMWVTHRASTDDPWGKPVKFEPLHQKKGANYNLSYAQGDTKLYFSSGWATFPAKSFDIWEIEVTPIMDFNGDSVVDTGDVYELLDHWGTTGNSLYDIAPAPLGDGLVNEKDLFALAEHMVTISDGNDL